MRKHTNLRNVVGIVLVLTVMASFLTAAEEQQRPQRGQRGGERGGQRGGFDRAAMQERMVEMMKERLGATDEEWTIIKPRLEKVMTLSQNARGMDGMRFMFGRGQRGGDRQMETPTEPVQIAASELQNTLDKEAPTAAEIKAKLAALRGAREKNQQELVTAQQSLKEVLTIKQEALLVMMGMLD